MSPGKTHRRTTDTADSVSEFVPLTEASLELSSLRRDPDAQESVPTLKLTNSITATPVSSVPQKFLDFSSPRQQEIGASGSSFKTSRKPPKYSSPRSSDSTPRNHFEKQLIVNLLKERLELEVALKREGLRFFITLLFGVLFCLTRVGNIQPRQQYDAHWIVSKRLQVLDELEPDTSRAAFLKFKEVSSLAREFYPLSSNYVDTSISKAYVGSQRQFPDGPELLPLEARPKLLKAWSLYTWLSLADSLASQQKRRLLIREHVVHGDRDLTCWALYCKGKFHYTLEYGEHALESGLMSIDFTFNSSAISTDPTTLTMIALSVNKTHASVYLQAAGEERLLPGWEDPIVMPGVNTRELPLGTAPTECPGGTILLGDRGVTLAAFKYIPHPMTELKFHEIEEIGQSLQDLAAGIGKPQEVEIDTGNKLRMAAHGETQELVKDSSEDLSTLIRLSGSMSYEAAQGVAGDIPGRWHAPVRGAPVGEPVSDPALWSEALAAAPRPPGTFFQAAPGGNVTQGLGPCGEPASSGLSQVLTGAFQALRGAGAAAFSLSWWVKRSGPDASLSEELVQETLTIEDVQTGLRRLEVSFRQGPELPANGGWMVRFNSAPLCLGAEDEGLCMASPAFWCQAPTIDKYHDIWRHVLLRFSPSFDDVRSSMELFLDGRLLCGVTFQHNNSFVPHFPLDPSAAPEIRADFCNAAASHQESNWSIQLTDMRLYAESLTLQNISDASQDSEFYECIDMSVVTDNPSYQSEFGQGCADLAMLSSRGSDLVPGGCRLRAAQENCPISCIHEAGSVCYDGAPPIAAMGEGLSSLPRAMLYEDAVWRVMHPSYATEAYWRRLQDAKVSWIRDHALVWHMLFSMVDIFPSGDAITAMDLPDQRSGEHYWMKDHAAPGSPGWCPGSELVPSLFEPICEAEILRDAILDKVAESGISSGDLNIAYDFKSGVMMKPGQSSTTYFWVKGTPAAQDSLRLAGMDASGNLCFHITSRSVSLFRRGLFGENSTHERLSSDEAISTLELSFPDVHVSGSSEASGAWTFFALSIDAQQQKFTFAIDEYLKEQHLPGLKEGEWGCNSLSVILNVGIEVTVAPIYVSEFSLLPGSIQELYLSTQSTHKHMLGPEISHIDRIEKFDLPRRRFTSPVVGIAPPLLMQSQSLRYSGSSASGECAVSAGLSANLVETKKDICKHPYTCTFDDDIIDVPCQQDNATLGDRFFGHTAKKYHGLDYFPDFAWSLENEFVVRDSLTLIPEFDYINRDTSKVTLLLPFYATQTKVAGIMEMSMDFSSPRISADITFYNTKILSPEELREWEALMVACIAVAVLLVLLALPAAIQETKSLIRYARNKSTEFGSTMVSRMISRIPSDNRIFSFSNPSLYSLDTTQPDLLDVLSFLGLTIFLIVEIVVMRDLNDRIQYDFSQVAGKDWGDETTLFDEKIDLFLEKIQDAEYCMDMQSNMKMASFVILIFLGLRMIVFMKVHPRLAAIAKTFEIIATEMVNFLFSFGIIFFFLAFTAHMKFGNEIEAFSTLRDALLTQFVVLLAVDLPPFGSDTLLTLYVASYVVLCALALLNFFLAIVVNGYTKAQEQALENRVVRSFFSDVVRVCKDMYLWGFRHRSSWPAKMLILKAMAKKYPRIFENGYRQANVYRPVFITEEEFQDLISSSPLILDAARDASARQNKMSRSRLKILQLFGTSLLSSDVLKMGASTMFNHYVKHHPYLCRRHTYRSYDLVKQQDLEEMRSNGVTIIRT